MSSFTFQLIFSNFFLGIQINREFETKCIKLRIQMLVDAAVNSCLVYMPYIFALWLFCASFHFVYNSYVEFRTRGLCKRSGWKDVMRAARLACRGTGNDRKSISGSILPPSRTWKL